MKKISLIVVTLIMFNGCSLLNTKKGDNREWVEVSCNGFADWSKCNDKAARLCPDGYDVGAKEESLIAQKRTMQLACKK